MESSSAIGGPHVRLAERQDNVKRIFARMVSKQDVACHWWASRSGCSKSVKRVAQKAQKNKETRMIQKDTFIKATLEGGVLMFGQRSSPFTLKSGRQALLFFNAGNADRGSLAEMLAESLADLVEEDLIKKNGLFEKGVGKDHPILCFGLPYKCIHMAGMVAAALCRRGVWATFNSYRKEEKDHGGDAASILIERSSNIRDANGYVAVIDDVITDGASKSEGLEVLQRVAKEGNFELHVMGVYILVDRQEVTSTDVNTSAVQQFEAANNIPIRSFTTAFELIRAARDMGKMGDEEYATCVKYARIYGSPAALELYKAEMPAHIIEQPLLIPGRGVIPACDFTQLELFKALCAAISDVPKVTALKVGSLLVCKNSMEAVVKAAREAAPGKKLVLDMQKWGSDIPDMVYKQVKLAAEEGFDAVILFPLQGGPEALLAGIHACYEFGIVPIVGGDMTHRGFDRAEGGCVTLEDSKRFYGIAASKGVRNFVMPGTKPDRIAIYRELLSMVCKELSVFSPGFVTQQGNISAGGVAAGVNFQAIIGRAIFMRADGSLNTAGEMRAAAIELTKQL